METNFLYAYVLYLEKDAIVESDGPMVESDKDVGSKSKYFILL